MLAPISSLLDSLTAPGSPVANSCAGTSRAYAQALHFASSLSAPHGRGVGIGSDVVLNRMPDDSPEANVADMLRGFATPIGLAGSLGGLPAAAHWAMYNDGAPGMTGDPANVLAVEKQKVHHLHDGTTYASALDRCVAGTYGFDFNFDGLAHHGLVPDLLQDLKSIGTAQATFDALFSSAETYLRI